jgi:hypothetical protein
VRDALASSFFVVRYAQRESLAALEANLASRATSVVARIQVPEDQDRALVLRRESLVLPPPDRFRVTDSEGRVVADTAGWKLPDHLPSGKRGGVRINPFLNIATNIAFEPLGDGKAAAPDFGMVASEINPVVRIMRKQGWGIGCLYNQETAEHPQLFFSHQFKTGDPIQLAREIRNGLNLTDVKFK